MILYLLFLIIEVEFFVILTKIIEARDWHYL